VIDAELHNDEAPPGDWDEWSATAKLVRHAQQGDRDAYGSLIERFQPTVYAIALGRLGNAAEAQELTQDVFLHAMSRLGQVREPERFAGWIRQVAANLAINRATRRVPPALIESEFLGDAAYAFDDPLGRMIDRERAERLWTGLGRLRPLDRDTLIAFYIDGFSLLEISSRHEAPVGTIKRRLHTARKRLRHVLESELPDADEWVDDLEVVEYLEEYELESVA
jgi:RNA polymerase sigma-70 factor (ECF subfamily)